MLYVHRFRAPVPYSVEINTMNTPLPQTIAAILFWGFQSGQWAPAILLAAAAAGSRLIEIRWDLKEVDFRRIVLLCAALVAGLTIYRFMTGWYNHAAWMMVKWAPLITAPLFLAQLYSLSGRVDLHSLNPFKGKGTKPPVRRPKHIDISHAYAALCVLAAAAANVRTPLFYIGAALLTGMALWKFRPARCSRGSWILLFLLACGVGYAGQLGLSNLYDIALKRTIGWMTDAMNDHSGEYNKFNMIGEIGDEKISNRIVFRTRPGESETPPHLFQEAVYDIFRSDLNMWSASRTDFRPLHADLKENVRLLRGPGGAIRDCEVAHHLRGVGREMLRLPPGVNRIDGLEDVKGERNGLGTVKVKGDGPVVYRPSYFPGTAVTSPPSRRDREIPPREAETLGEIVKRLGLRKLEPDKILEITRSFFSSRFTYTLESQPRKSGTTLMENFLLHTRAGHCEYFATSAALILRAAGMPTRYVRGYAVDPADQMGGWHQVRARHAHAWVSAYAGDRWITLDPTPGSWRAAERAAAPWHETLTDYWDWLTFRLSRVTFGDTEKITAHLSWLLIPALAFAGWRIWRRRIKRKKKSGKPKTPAPPRPAPGMDSHFYRVEKRLNDMGFIRREWETLAAWLNRIEQTSESPAFPAIPGKLLLLHNRRRFDTRGLTDDEKAYMESMVSKWENDCHNEFGSISDIRL